MLTWDTHRLTFSDMFESSRSLTVSVRKLFVAGCVGMLRAPSSSASVFQSPDRINKAFTLGSQYQLVSVNAQRKYSRTS